MNAVTFLLVYAMALSWLAPVLFTSPISASIHPRLSVAGWLVVVATALFAWVAALVILITGAAHSLVTHTAPTFCVETLGIASAVTLPPTVATALVVALLLVTAAVATNTTHRVIVTLYRTRRANCQHVEAVRIIGRPTDHDGVVAITAEQPTAYCVSGGGQSAIVVTTAVLELLNPPALAAVLAHERAHLRGRHHHIIATLSTLAAALPRLPLMRAAARSVPALLEMCADDAATRKHGREPLLASLVTLSTRHRLPDGVLAAAGTAVADRVARLMQPRRAVWWHPQSLAMMLIVIGTAAAPAFALTLCTLQP
ncbi:MULTISPECIES: M56 family metallopeptidase [unclassified Mycolicibacterium]|uniref:M56 family metallopeptidase n=1 Tax=unclassified Mycolicibacterium TaxID=2636767 RepID=UPI0012DC1DE9|nr:MULTISPECIES: M56 family metallopeptidase [unclassified Mycolicibacterium]MUL82211.1 M56 family metallopeptidase [Mycolicibacterium sp. CBMA 329]MUL87977.1 M56 family metallopeptidase [Mycolicibacterium sp. CBMA 331]MUM02308.1 M56 family metallopeptidase [Mycolicibacterium sp. CBMA 334]MUM26380.1 M56 family metallopeptidase [Mycolicibacterium sp. CBMA 295]MUM38274.1 M56 family metallopeptidase [Mycolicibacterium sp. CBMA 247]